MAPACPAPVAPPGVAPHAGPMTEQTSTTDGSGRQTLTVELTVSITDADALVQAVRESTPKDALAPDDIREEDRASSSLVAGLSKAVKGLSVPGVQIHDATVVSPR